jgi:hypothetical protein
MARRVFFSFHYERDIWRANVVRKSWVTQDRESAGFWDASLWEKAKKEGDDAVRKLIDEGMKGASVTAVLIGMETSSRKWVRYEIRKSYEEGKGILGVFIHGIEDADGKTDEKGEATFGEIGKDKKGNSVYFHDVARKYDWVGNGGYDNFGDWVEQAAKDVGR